AYRRIQKSVHLPPLCHRNELARHSFRRIRIGISPFEQDWPKLLLLHFSPLPCSVFGFRNARSSPRSFRSCATALAALLRVFAVSCSRCRAMTAATCGGVTRRTVPVSLTCSRKIVPPSSFWR